jgi:hypothetical protein
LSSRLAGSQSDRDVPPTDEIDSRLAQIAETLKPVVVLKRVAQRLAPVRLIDRAAVARLASDQPTLEALEEEISTRLPTPAVIDEVRRWWDEEESVVADNWDTSWRDLAPGGDVLEVLWSEFDLAYDKNRDGTLIAESMTTMPKEIQELLEEFVT